MPDAIYQTYREIDIRELDPDALHQLSKDMKLSLLREDMVAIQQYFNELNRHPTDVELEVIAQTWSEHCKHRIFGARIEHVSNGVPEVVDGLFKTYIKDVTDKIRERKPGFVLAAFDDNAGFVKLDDRFAICLKVETHNHPSALEPYAGANTGLGGVIRDILGAGKGAKPVASLDVFCFGPPDTTQEDIKAEDVIHPLGIMRGVVRGVRDYGNRMGIPTVGGAIQFDNAYIYNPLVYCGTAGVIPIGDIHKEVKPGHKILAVGGRTGRDGLHGATFSSASLSTDSHAQDQTAVQIGNPIEEKKVCDFILAARGRGLIEFVTDCGAGGFSSAAGEMLSEVGGFIYLDNCPLKEPGMVSWEIFLSESQERMVLAVREESLPELFELANTFETEAVVIGDANGSGILTVTHQGSTVCELNNQRLHDAPRRHFKTEFTVAPPVEILCDESTIAADLKKVLGDFAIVSREPIIREYDHEVQGNTVLKPLAGATGDAPQDSAVFAIDGSEKLVAMSQSLLPEWGKTDPFAMGTACVDECIRQLVAAGSDPDRICILDNFCMGNPDDPEELGALVETTKGIADAATKFAAPFVSGKDSFYNFFETDEGPVSIPVTILISGLGILDTISQVTGSSFRTSGSLVCVLGENESVLGGSVYARVKGLLGGRVPSTDSTANLERYRQFHELVKQGVVRSAHDVSEGGLAVTLAEMAFSEKCGVEATLPGDTIAADLFSESPGRIVFEVAPTELEKVEGIARIIGWTTSQHSKVVIKSSAGVVVDEEIAELKAIWKNGLAAYY